MNAIERAITYGMDSSPFYRFASTANVTSPLRFNFSSPAGYLQTAAQMPGQSIVPIPDFEILKVGHHGSRNASSPQVLNLIKPDVVVYSCGVENTYGHPHQETLVALDSSGARIYGIVFTAPQ